MKFNVHIPLHRRVKKRRNKNDKNFKRNNYGNTLAIIIIILFRIRCRACQKWKTSWSTEGCEGEKDQLQVTCILCGTEWHHAVNLKLEKVSSHTFRMHDAFASESFVSTEIPASAFLTQHRPKPKNQKRSTICAKCHLL